MAVHKDDSGRRKVEVEVEVPGTPEEVWRTIATAEGISSWFVPTTTEYDAEGKPIRMTSDYGPGMESIAKITEWNPPHAFFAETKDFGDDGPTVATQWIVESRGGDMCVVRVVHSLFASTDDWDDQMEGWESGWPGFFRLLRLYLTHFPGQESSTLQLSGFAPTPKSSAWTALFTALGLDKPQAGQRCQSSGSAPALAGAVERVGDAAYPEELLLRLDTPALGIGHLFAMEIGEQVLLSLRFYLYGDAALGVGTRDEPVWQAWIGKHFPALSQSESGHV